MQAMFTQPKLRGRHDSTAESQTAAGPTPQPTPAESIQPQGTEECGLERIGLFWAAEPLQGPTDAFRTSGARVAAATWTQALVAHVSVPRIDVFVPITDLDWCRQRLLRTRIQSGDDGATLRLHAGSAVAERMREQRPSVLHYPGCDLTALSYIRSRFSRRIFPVTCSHMAASYNESFLQFAVRLLSTRIYSCDAIVCATEA